MKHFCCLFTRVFFLFIFSGALTAAAGAQVTDGSISGQVMDSSGARVPNVKVTITNTGTGQTRTTQTNGTGAYHVDLLQPGTYKVEASMDGFQTKILQGIAVIPNGIARADLSLSAAGATQSIEVMNDAVTVNTEDARIVTTLTEEQVRDLPTEQRQVYSLSTQQPGVVATLAPVVSNSQYTRYNYGFSANGASARSNNFVLDGVSNNNEWLGGTPALNPSVEAIEDFQVQTLNFSPQYGRNSGAVVALTTRSGTNAYHGVVYEYLRNPMLDAQNYFATPTAKTAFHFNDFGGTFSGPIIKDKTFFFINYEGVRISDASVVTTTGETPDFRAQVALYKPNSIANAQLSKYPTNPCNSGTQRDLGTISGSSTAVYGLCTAVYQNKRPVSGYQYMVRVDHHFSANDAVFLRALYDTHTSDSGLEQLRGSEVRGFKAPFYANFPSGLFGYTHLFSSTALNDLRFAFMREKFGIDFQAPSSTPTNNYPLLYFNNGYTSFGPGGPIPRNFVFNTYQITDMFAISHGHHNVKVGFEFERIQENSDYKNGTNGTYYFTNEFAFANDSPYEALGLVNPLTGNFTGTPRNFRNTNLAGFLMDDWKPIQNLTLNLGVRYDLYKVPTEANGKLSNMVLSDYSGASNVLPTTAQLQNATVGVVHNFWKGDKANFSPRIGIDYDPFGKGKSAIRAGYAMAYQAPYSNEWSNTSRFDAPYAESASVYPGSYGGAITYTVPATPSAGFKTGLLASGAPASGAKTAPTGISENLKSAYSEQWFVGVEQSLMSHYVLTVNYVGTKGVGLFNSDNKNRYTGNRTSLSTAATGINTSFSSMSLLQNSNHSNYNGMNVQLRKDPSHGLSFTVNYTLGKELDLVGEPGQGDYTNVDVGYGSYEDEAKPYLDYGSGEFDVRHRLAANGLWEIPAPFKMGWKKLAFSSWQLNGVVSLQTGRHITVYCSSTTSCDYNADGTGYDRPNTPAFGNILRGLTRKQYVGGIFKASDFPAPTFGTDGNLGRGTFLGPGFSNVDMSLFKKFPIHNTLNFQFRIETLNIFNRANLYIPTMDLSNTLFGKSTTAFDPRRIQIALKLQF